MSAPCSDTRAPVIFRTPRLNVRGYADADADRHHALRADPDVRRYMHWSEGEDFAAVLAAGRGRVLPDERGWLNLAVARHGALQPIGDFGLRVENRIAWLGLALLPEARRQGHGRELVSAAMRWLRSHGIRHFRAEIDFGNAASFALFFALGFRVIADRMDEFGPFAELETVSR